MYNKIRVRKFFSNTQQNLSLPLTPCDVCCVFGWFKIAVRNFLRSAVGITPHRNRKVRSADSVFFIFAAKNSRRLSQKGMVNFL